MVNDLKKGLNREKSFKIRAVDGIRELINNRKRKVYWVGEEPRIIKTLNIYLNKRRYYWRRKGKKPRTELEWKNF